jgi:putative transcriptional regulator
LATKANAQSTILSVIHETATDLQHIGFIDKWKMQKYEALCLEPCRNAMPQRFVRCATGFI